MENNNIRQMAMKWLPEEEQFIRLLKEDEGVDSWKEIAKKLEIKFPRKKRTGPQCRDRYINYIKFRKNRSKRKGWLRKEELMIMQTYIEIGPQWKKMVEKFVDRSENELKNKFHSTTRKFIRTLNEQLLLENEVSFLEISRILNFMPEPGFFCPQLEPMNKFRNNLISSIFERHQKFSDVDSLKLTKQIHRYSSLISEICLDQDCQAKRKNKNPFFFCKPNIELSRKKKKEREEKKIPIKEENTEMNKSGEIHIDEQFKSALEMRIVSLFVNIFENSKGQCLNYLQNYVHSRQPQYSKNDQIVFNMNLIQIHPCQPKQENPENLINLPVP